MWGRKRNGFKIDLGGRVVNFYWYIIGLSGVGRGLRGGGSVGCRKLEVACEVMELGFFFCRFLLSFKFYLFRLGFLRGYRRVLMG